ncbi:MAG: hypothetical protein R3E10_13595 [Gemmatimonadota bacterium]
MAWYSGIAGRFGPKTVLEAAREGAVHRLDHLLASGKEPPDRSTWEDLLDAAIRLPPNIDRLETDRRNLPRPGLLEVLLRHGAPYDRSTLWAACRELNARAVAALLGKARGDGRDFVDSPVISQAFASLLDGVADENRGRRSFAMGRATAEVLLAFGANVNARDDLGNSAADRFGRGGTQSREFEEFLTGAGARPSTPEERIDSIVESARRWKTWLSEAARGEHQPIPEDMDGYAVQSLDFKGFVTGVLDSPATSHAAEGRSVSWSAVVGDLATCLRRAMECDARTIVDLLDRRLWAVCQGCGSAVNGDAIQTVAAAQSAGALATADERLARLVRGSCAHCDGVLLILCWQGDTEHRGKLAALNRSHRRRPSSLGGTG